MATFWSNDTDFFNDLKELSDFYQENSSEHEPLDIVKPQKSAASVLSSSNASSAPNRRKHHSKSSVVKSSAFPRSIYDFEEDDYEDEIEAEVPEQIAPGGAQSRGRGWRSARENEKLRNPGESNSFLDQFYEKQRAIRQVSGIGFSNEYIEHFLRSPTKSNSRTSNKYNNHKTEHSAPQGVAADAEACNSPPLPLYDILHHNKKVSELNLESKTDFPELKPVKRMSK